MKKSDVGGMRYTSHDYLHNNPTWDMEDSPWKARKVMELLSYTNRAPSSICEVGCGAGGILAELRKVFPDSELFGYDIAPDAARFWAHHAWAKISFEVGDLFEMNQRRFDVLLLIDVIEHLENPFSFLRRLRAYGRLFVFHFPLDLSVCNILRETPLLRARSKVGHLHLFTKHLALAMLKECHYHILDCRYTEAAFTSPQRNWKSRLATFPRRVVYRLNKDFGVRLLGGETLMVLARAKDESDNQRG